MNPCPFCAIIAGRQPSTPVFENEDFVCFHPLYQEVPGHTLVVSRCHYSSFLDAPFAIGASLIHVFNELANVHGVASYNILNANGADAQQSVMHLHLHFLPRRNNDGINAWPELYRVAIAEPPARFD
jgi:histidine triad (HIT) family protein